MVYRPNLNDRYFKPDQSAPFPPNFRHQFRVLGGNSKIQKNLYNYPWGGAFQSPMQALCDSTRVDVKTRRFSFGGQVFFKFAVLVPQRKAAGGPAHHRCVARTWTYPTSHQPSGSVHALARYDAWNTFGPGHCEDRSAVVNVPPWC